MGRKALHGHRGYLVSPATWPEGQWGHRGGLYRGGRQGRGGGPWEASGPWHFRGPMERMTSLEGTECGIPTIRQGKGDLGDRDGSMRWGP